LACMPVGIEKKQHKTARILKRSARGRLHALTT